MVTIMMRCNIRVVPVRMHVLCSPPQMVGATTVEEWRQRVEPDAAFARRWAPLMVHEPSEEAALRCLQGACAPRLHAVPHAVPHPLL